MRGISWHYPVKVESHVTSESNGAEVLAPKYREEACQRAKEIEPIIRELQEKGYSRNRIAMELNKRKVPTPRGGRWESVRNVMRRLAA